MAFNCISAPLAINRIDNLHLQFVIKVSTCGSSNKIGFAEGCLDIDLYHCKFLSMGLNVTC
ncbi:hypothetical protein PanWU01x14_339700 [Parasponia andersonii]|uniref:Uncharacterized protein n=1 Tax=Parasponia andersonii TaxID=3476 RepID=A0A2P5AEM5_PARAD|nr:hypothetical protein PanWU01x14_339700 [Parasponia andersonii]